MLGCYCWVVSVCEVCRCDYIVEYYFLEAIISRLTFCKHIKPHFPINPHKPQFQQEDHMIQLENAIKATEEAALDAADTDSVMTGTSIAGKSVII